MTGSRKRSIGCVGAVIFDGAGRLLLVRRMNEPGRGRWTLPGGRIEPGESNHQALRREVAEETGLRVSVTRLVGSVRRPAPGDAVFHITDYACDVVGGTARAGDDADDVRWCDRATLAQLPLVAGLFDALTEWECLPD